MHRLEFSIDIVASKQKIWNALWADELYRKWAGVFFAGSYIKVNAWEVGATVYFLNADKSGIYSKIIQYEPDSLVTYKHIGNVVNGEAKPLEAESEKWSGATETYRIVEGSEANTLQISLDVMDEHVDFMKETFPEALDLIKANSE